MTKKQNWFDKLKQGIKDNPVKSGFTTMTSFTSAYKFVKTFLEIKGNINMAALLHSSDFLWAVFMFFLTICFIVWWFISTLLDRVKANEKRIEYLYIKDAIYSIVYNKYKSQSIQKDSGIYSLSTSDLTILNDNYDNELIKNVLADLDHLIIIQKGMKHFNTQEYI